MNCPTCSFEMWAVSTAPLIARCRRCGTIAYSDGVAHVPDLVERCRGVLKLWDRGERIDGEQAEAEQIRSALGRTREDKP